MPSQPDSSDTKTPKEPARLREYAQWEGDNGQNGEKGADLLAGLNLEKMQAELDGKIAQEKGLAAWLRARPTPVRAMLASLLLGVIIIGTMATWLRPDFEIYPAIRMQAVLGTIAVLIVLNVILVLWPLQFPAAPRWLMAAAVLSAPIGLFFWYSAPPAHTHPRSFPSESFGLMVGHASRCLIVGSAVAGSMFALLAGLDRGGSNRLLLMAACAGLLMLQLHCSNTSPTHLVFGHLGVVVLCFGFAIWRERVRGFAA
jgi:hypothetical protein